MIFPRRQAYESSRATISEVSWLQQRNFPHAGWHRINRSFLLFSRFDVEAHSPVQYCDPSQYPRAGS
jgi:hypothetical protein